MSTLKPYCYVFVRRDIPVADQIVQVGHACLEAGRTFEHPEDTHMVLIGVKDKKKLADVARKIMEQEDMTFCQFFEPDDDMGYTSLATGPIYGEQRQLFSKYKLWSI